MPPVIPGTRYLINCEWKYHQWPAWEKSIMAQKLTQTLIVVVLILAIGGDCLALR